MGIRKGFIVLPFLAALLGVLAACLPQPDEPVEYLQQPDSITIQIRVVDLSASDLEQRLAVPEFTLYGDGTLIYTTERAPSRLLQTKLPDDAVRELLEFIVDAGFLNFSYRQPEPDWRDRQPTTFIYAHTLALANAVSAYAVDTNLPPNAGDEWDQCRALREIAERLRAVDPVALGGSKPVEFVPEAIVLQVRSFGEPPYEGDPDFVSANEINLAEIVPLGSAPTEHLVEGQLAGELWGNFGAVSNGHVPPVVSPIEQGDRNFLIRFLPILPYEENFPEFDIQ